MRSVLAVAAFGAFVASSVATSQALANIVLDGEFLSGSGTTDPFWTFTPAASASDFAYGSPAFSGAGLPFAGYTGNYANFGATGSTDDEIDQVLSTVPGDSYTISFYLSNADDSGVSDFSAYFGTDQLLSLTNPGAFGWTLETFTATATSASTDLAFLGRQPPSWYSLTDISVDPATAVPEPGSLVLFSSALFGLVMLRRRKRTTRENESL